MKEHGILKKSLTLQNLANCAVILAALALTTQSVVGLYPKLRPQTSTYYAIGSRVAETRDLTFHGSPQTLLLVTASNCHFCIASAAFHARLASAMHAVGGRVVGVTHEDPIVNKAFLGSEGITVDSVISDVASKVEIRGTPSLILVDRDGKVSNRWTGKLSDAKENDVLAAIKNGSKT